MIKQLSKNFQQPVMGLLSSERRDFIEKFMDNELKYLHAQYGVDFLSCSQAEVSAHEAGHVIALKAMGGFLDSAIIQQVHKKSVWQPYEAWIGFTDVDQRYGVAVGPDEDVRQLKLITIKTLAGIVAEAELADRTIPSSSVDELALATLYSVWIGQQLGQSSQCVLEELDRRTRNLLRLNKSIAQAIAQKLHVQFILSKVELDEMLINVTPWPIHDLGTLQHEEMQPDVAV